MNSIIKGHGIIKYFSLFTKFTKVKRLARKADIISDLSAISIHAIPGESYRKLLKDFCEYFNKRSKQIVKVDEKNFWLYLKEIEYRFNYEQQPVESKNIRTRMFENLKSSLASKKIFYWNKIQCIPSDL